MKGPVLGRGFSALLPELPKRTVVQDVPVGSIFASDIQPRKGFEQAALEQLAASIKEKGILQPILARRTRRGIEVVAGERRLRAARMAGLATVPVIISDDVPDGTALEIALIENIQRQDLNPIEEAEAYRRLLGENSLTHDEVAKRVGKSRSAVTNTLRLLDLPDEVKRLLESGELGAGHARALIALGDYDRIVEEAHRAVAEGLSVREVELAVGARRGELNRVERAAVPRASADRDGVAAEKRESPELRDLSERMQRALGTKVRIVERSKREGRIEIEYFSPLDLDRIADRIIRR